MLVTFLKPEGNFLKKLSIFRLLNSIFEYKIDNKNCQPISGKDKNSSIKKNK
jgi:hypothetical protein